MLQVGVHARRVVVLADRCTQVGPGLFARIVATEPFDLVVAGNSDPAPGDGGGAAVLGGLLHHQYRQPLVVGP